MHDHERFHFFDIIECCLAKKPNGMAGCMYGVPVGIAVNLLRS